MHTNWICWMIKKQGSSSKPRSQPPGLFVSCNPYAVFKELKAESYSCGLGWRLPCGGGVTAAPMPPYRNPPPRLMCSEGRTRNSCPNSVFIFRSVRCSVPGESISRTW